MLNSCSNKTFYHLHTFFNFKVPPAVSVLSHLPNTKSALHAFGVVVADTKRSLGIARFQLLPEYLSKPLCRQQSLPVSGRIFQRAGLLLSTMVSVFSSNTFSLSIQYLNDLPLRFMYVGQMHTTGLPSEFYIGNISHGRC